MANANRELYDPESDQRRLAELLLETVRYIPLLTALLAIALLATYALSRYGLLGEASWQILAVTGSTLLAGLAQVSIVALARRGRGYAAVSVLALVLALWGWSLVLFAESALPIAILIVWAGPITALAARSNRRVLGAAALAGSSSATAATTRAVDSAIAQSVSVAATHDRVRGCPGRAGC